MNGWIILCDFAEVINGKLYIQGGGWSRLNLNVVAGQGVSVYIAGKVLVPWTDTNQRRSLKVSLVDADGAQVLIDEKPIAIDGEFEVGRPPGLPPGTEIDVPLSFRFEGVPIPPGRYRWELSIADEPIAQATFDVIAP